MKHQKMQIEFGGQEHQIDSNTLINVLIHYNTIISEANRSYSGGSKNVTVKIDALQQGSFVVDLSLQETLINIFSTENIAYLSGLVSIVGGVFGAYKLLKGKPAKTEDELKIKIKGNDNVIKQTIINVYNNPLTREAISKSIATANEDANVESIKITGENTTPVEIKKEEFAALIYNDFDKENIPDEKAEIKNDVVLTITKLSFERGGQWQFLYNGFKIPLTVKDDALMKIINDGARFGKGDSIRVDLQINQKYVPEYNGYENKSYRIVSFKEHILAPKQQVINMQ
jgi:hypothetical protein